MQLSINIGWFEDQHPSKNYGLDFYKLPEILKKSGFDALEFYPSVCSFSANPDNIRKIVHSADLYFYSGHLPMVGGQLSFNEEIYNERLAYIKDWIDFYAKLGIKVAVIHPDEVPFPLKEHPKRMEFCVLWAHELAKHAQKHNMKIAVETTWGKGSLFAYRNNIAYFKERIKAPNLGFCFDTGHAYGSESPSAKTDADMNFYETWNLMKDKIFTFHLHNTYKSCDFHNPFSMGDIDFKQFFTEVKKMNYDFPLTIEMNPVKALGVNPSSDIKDWGGSVNNGNIEKAMKATVRMFRSYYDKA